MAGLIQVASRGPTCLGRALVVGALALALWALAGFDSRTAMASGLNVERMRLRPDDDGLTGEVQLGVDFQAGNTNRLDLRSSASLAFRRGRNLMFLIGSSTYSTRTRAIEGEGLGELLDPESRFINKAQAHARYNYELLPWITAETFAQVQRNEFLLLESRILFGLGPRFVPVNNGHFSLALGTDYMLEYEALNAARVIAPLPADTLVHRWSTYLSLVYDVDERLTMSSTTYVQPRFDLFGDLRMLSEATLDVTLVEPLTFRLVMNVRWDSQPSTYCTTSVGIAGCPGESQVRLREIDIGLQNSLSVRF